MSFVTTLSEKMFCLAVVDGDKPTGLWCLDKQVPLFLDIRPASELMEKYDLGPRWRVLQTTKWDSLRDLLRIAQAAGADSVAFVPAEGQGEAAPIEDVIGHLTDICAGKHDGDPTNPN